MTDPRFVHLHVHSEYSLLDSLVRVPQLIERCSSLGMPAVAVTDENNVFALAKLQRAARQAGIKPISGAELWINSTDSSLRKFKLVLLCQNTDGYRNLSRLVTQSFRYGTREGNNVALEETWLTSQSVTGLIALSAGTAGDLGQLVRDGKADSLERRIDHWQHIFSDRYYLELTRTGNEQEERYIDAMLNCAGSSGAPVVATNDVRYLEAREFEAHEARVCIHQGRKLSDPRRPKLYTPGQYFRSEEEMCELFGDVPEALENSVNIAIRCNFELEFGNYHLPEYPVSENSSINELLRRKTVIGLDRRLISGVFGERETSRSDEGAYRTRLEDELSVITAMGFAGYFLIVADFIDWAKEHKIPVGPGRGSGAGSLVAFALGITELDPIEYGLLFERFLNPERVSMPDFDIDFCMDRRDEVIDYVTARYGRDKVAQIITLGTMAAKAVVRDVGRVLGFPYGFIDTLAKLIPFDPQMTLRRALTEEPMLKRRCEEDEDVKSIMDLALELEGLSRNAGKHAGGVVIAPTSLTDYMPLCCEEGGDALVTQFDMGDIEAIGLVKFDFLGLRTLTIIDWALKDINRQRAGQDKTPVDIANVPLNDAKTFELVQHARTTAVFQLESGGMKKLIKRLHPDSFEDMIALVALFRPGPLQSGMVEDFIDRKHGRAAVRYSHPALEPILEPTHGVILYQEQVMQIARDLAGYTLGNADLLRRAMGKKKPEEMALQREIFVEGAKQNGISEGDSTFIFDLMEKFAGYGFNKSHSAAYALVAYQTAWLKAHYSAAFMAAVLSSHMDTTDQVVRLMDECRILNIEVIPPNINLCRFRFSTANERTIRYGLGALKGLGEGVIGAIVKERERHGQYRNLVDLCKRNSEKRINRRALEALIKAGAMDCFGQPRASLMSDIERVLQITQQHLDADAAGQGDFIGLPDANDASAGAVNVPYQATPEEWTPDQILAYEKETLGLYMSGHPIDRYAAELANVRSCTLAELTPGRRLVAGLILAKRDRKTRRGRMAVLTLDDRTARTEVTVYRELYEQHLNELVEDQIVIVEGKCDVDDFTEEHGVEAAKIMTVEQARNSFARMLVLNVSETELGNGFIGTLRKLIDSSEGGCPVAIQYERPGCGARLMLGERWRVNATDSLIDGLKDQLGEQRVTVEY